MPESRYEIEAGGASPRTVVPWHQNDAESVVAGKAVG